jgi:hypothetical protein
MNMLGVLHAQVIYLLQVQEIVMFLPDLFLWRKRGPLDFVFKRITSESERDFWCPPPFYYMQNVLMDRFLCDVRLLAMDHVLECCYLPRLLRFVGVL